MDPGRRDGGAREERGGSRAPFERVRSGREEQGVFRERTAEAGHDSLGSDSGGDGVAGGDERRSLFPQVDMGADGGFGQGGVAGAGGIPARRNGDGQRGEQYEVAHDSGLLRGE